MNVIRVAKSGINALTNTDPSNYHIYVDQSIDHVLVKEKSRGTSTLGSFSNTNISHSLGYFPFTAQMVEISSGEFQWVYNTPGASFNPFYSYVTTSNLFLDNSDGSSRTFTYLIFYDVV